jgi:hypothetical protein
MLKIKVKARENRKSVLVTTCQEKEKRTLQRENRGIIKIRIKLSPL